MRAENIAMARKVRGIMPFDAVYQHRAGRVIGRLLDWPLFRPDDGSADIEISWSVADKLSVK